MNLEKETELRKSQWKFRLHVLYVVELPIYVLLLANVHCYLSLYFHPSTVVLIYIVYDNFKDLKRDMIQILQAKEYANYHRYFKTSWFSHYQFPLESYFIWLVGK